MGPWATDFSSVQFHRVAAMMIALRSAVANDSCTDAYRKESMMITSHFSTTKTALFAWSIDLVKRQNIIINLSCNCYYF